MSEPRGRDGRDALRGSAGVPDPLGAPDGPRAPGGAGGGPGVAGGADAVRGAAGRRGRLPGVPDPLGVRADGGGGYPGRGAAQWLTEGVAEALADAVGEGRQAEEMGAGPVFADEDDARAAGRLAALLAAARVAREPLDPAHEEAAVTAFRAARWAPPRRRWFRLPDRAGGRRGAAALPVLRTGAGARGGRDSVERAGLRTGSAGRPGGSATMAGVRGGAGARRMVVVGVASVLALGGVTAGVAGAGRLLVPVGGPVAGPVSGGTTAAVSPAGRTAGPSAASPASSSAAPRPLLPRMPDDPAATRAPSYSRAWCRTYLRGLGSRAAVGSPAVTTYCRGLLKAHPQAPKKQVKPAPDRLDPHPGPKPRAPRD